MANETKIIITANSAQAEAALGRLGHSITGVTRNMLSFSGMAGTLTGALSITAFAGFIKSSIDAADRLNDLSKSTGITIENLAGLQYAAEQSGGDLESIAQAINKLSVSMAKDGEKFVELGINAKEPIEALKQLSDLFIRIEDPQQRAAVAAELLGKSWAGTAPLLAEGGQRIDEMIKKGRDMSGVTAEMAAQSDQFNDNLNTLSFQFKSFGTVLANDVLPYLNQFLGQLTKGREIWGSFGGALFGAGTMNPFKTWGEQAKDLRAEIAGLEKDRARFVASGAPTTSIDTVLTGAKKRLEFAIYNQNQEALKLLPPGGYRDEGGRLAKSAGGLTPKEQKALDALLNPSKKTGTGRAGADPLAQIRAQEQAALLSLKKQADGYNELTEVEQTYWEIQFGAYKKFSSNVQQELLARAKIVDSIKAQGEATKELAEYDKMVEAVFSGGQEDFNKKLQAAYDILYDVDVVARAGMEWEKLLEIQRQFPEVISLEQIGQKYAQLFDTHKETMDEMSEYARQAGRNIQDAFAEFLFDPFSNSVGGMLENFELALRKMAAQALSSHILDWVGSWGESKSGEGGLMGFFGDLIGGMFGGGKAIGGSVNAGKAYLVGERGPELFRPSSAGTIIPNGQLSGGLTVVNNFNLAQPADRRTQEQIATLAGISIQNAMARGA